MGTSSTKDGTPVSTGVAGLDYVLRGGYAANRAHLIEGRPGSGKTTLGLQFLMEGARRGERCLFITLSESRRELMSVAQQHGWSLDGIDIYELIPPELSLDPKQQQSLVHSSDLELGETVRLAIDEIGRVRPTRLVFDSLSEVRLLSQGSLRYRRQVLALKSFFLLNDTTVLMLDDLSNEHDDLNLHSISHAVIRLEHNAPLYGPERRRMRVIKMRGTDFRGGYHDMIIRTGGVRVFPRLVAAEHSMRTAAGSAGSDNTELDALLGGGLDRGTSTLVIGPSGAGKSTLALGFVQAALRRGEPVFMACFDETRDVLLRRARGVGVELEPHIETGRLTVRQIDPANIPPGEFAQQVREAVEREGARMVVIDSLTGYIAAMPDEQFVLLQMHETLTYLNQQGVVTLLVLAQHGMLNSMTSSIDLTYLSDSVIVLRFFEALGTVRRAVSVLKKRTGAHEDSIRELRIDRTGIRLGKALAAFRGVLTGVPTFDGRDTELLQPREFGSAGF